MRKRLAISSFLAVATIAVFGAAVPREGAPRGAQQAERSYPLRSLEAETLALLLHLNTPLDTTVDAKTTPTGGELVVTGPANVHDAIGAFVLFLNTQREGRAKRDYEEGLRNVLEAAKVARRR